MDQLLELIETKNIAAPSPIEQRWTSNSSSHMSPACGTSQQQEDLSVSLDLSKALHSWVGIIMYLPSEDKEVRQQITEAFKHYKECVKKKLWKSFDAIEHWAKIELPESELDVKKYQRRLAMRYPTESFNAARKMLDPKNILGNSKIDTLLPRQPPSK
mmetsp:Transcript_23866/g.31074  ORF Transcript_23866/g.31074 Transcript_23866/m.31074 type:complete len:158 (+) Transcript_23866:3-476(+)